MSTFAGLTGIIIFLLFLIVIALMLVSCVKIVPQAQALVVERLGAYLGTWSVGVHFLVPFVDRAGDFKRAGCGFCAPAGDYKR